MHQSNLFRLTAAPGSKDKMKFRPSFEHRAYELFELQGHRQGHGLDDSIEAEAEILRPYRHDLKESVEAVV